jgi:hypothetical protein
MKEQENGVQRNYWHFTNGLHPIPLMMEINTMPIILATNTGERLKNYTRS